MINYLKEGYKEKIVINSDDEDQLIAGRNFLLTLEKLNRDFVLNVEKVQKEFDIFIDSKTNKNVIFKPEALTRKSPMTLIDAKWGSGKTYFVETLLKNLALGKFPDVEFKRAILIDAWKISMSKETIARLFKNLFENLEKISPASKKDKIIKFGEAVYGYGKDYVKDKLRLKQTEIEGIERDYQNGIKEVIKETGTTLIFIDNIERVGRDAWDILKGISKLLVLSGFVVILPVNLQKLHNAYEEDYEEGNRDKGHIENPIEKYLDLKYFEFRQDYNGLLKKLGFDEKESEYYNMVLETVNEQGKIMSVREVENRIIGSGILKINNKDNRMILFQNNIWGAEEIFSRKIQDKITSCSKKLNFLFEKTQEIIKLFKIDYNQNSNNLLKEKIDIHNKKQYNNYIADPKLSYLNLEESLIQHNLLIENISKENSIIKMRSTKNKKLINQKKEQMIILKENFNNLQNLLEKKKSEMCELSEREATIEVIESNDEKLINKKIEIKQRIIKNWDRKIQLQSKEYSELEEEVRELKMQYERMQNEIIDFNNIDLSEIKEALIHFNSIFEDSLIFLKFKERYKEVESKFNDNDHQLILSDLLNYE